MAILHHARAYSQKVNRSIRLTLVPTSASASLPELMAATFGALTPTLILTLILILTLTLTLTLTPTLGGGLGIQRDVWTHLAAGEGFPFFTALAPRPGRKVVE
jgi:hypothetical protein